MRQTPDKDKPVNAILVKFGCEPCFDPTVNTIVFYHQKLS